MSLKDCYNFEDFRKLAKKRLPSPIFHYIDGGADDEITLRRNTNSFDDCDLIPDILRSVGEPDLSTTVFGRKIDMPIFLSPTAMQRLYLLMEIKHPQELLKNLEQCIACLRWPLFQSKRLQIYLVVQNYFSFIFIRINHLLMI